MKSGFSKSLFLLLLMPLHECAKYEGNKLFASYNKRVMGEKNSSDYLISFWKPEYKIDYPINNWTKMRYS